MNDESLAKIVQAFATDYLRGRLTGLPVVWSLHPPSEPGEQWMLRAALDQPGHWSISLFISQKNRNDIGKYMAMRAAELDVFADSLRAGRSESEVPR
jgi:hypothetical protein